MDGTTVNSAMLDAVEQVAAQDRPGDALSRVFEQASGLAMLNAVQAQQADNILADAALASIMARLAAVTPPRVMPEKPAPAVEPAHV